MTDVVLFGVDEARSITQRIKQSTDDLGALLLEAQEREAWKALGYGSWSAYVAGEFDFKRSRSYQLLSQAKINRALPAGERVSEPEARRLSTSVDTSDSEAVRAAVAEVRAHPKPGGGKRRGYQAPEEKARGLAETLEEWCDEADGETPMPTGFVRSLERIRDAATSLLYLHEEASKQPMRIDEWQSA